MPVEVLGQAGEAAALLDLIVYSAMKLQPSSVESPARPEAGKYQSIRKTLKQIEELQEVASHQYTSEIQLLVNKYNLVLATGHLSDTWQVRSPRGRIWSTEFYTDRKHNAFFQELEALDELVSEFGIGPSNMELFKPEK